MKSRAWRGASVPASAASLSRRRPSVRLHVQMGTGEANSPRATSRSTLATRCSSTVRMYVSGRPDWKAPQIARAARLSDAVWVLTFFDLLFIMDERPRDKDEPRLDFGLR